MNRHFSKKDIHIQNYKCWQECGEIGTLIYCWRECKMVHPLWKTMCRFLKKLILELLNDATIAFLGMYRRELQTRSQKDIWISTFTEALFTITKRWKQPKCPSLDEWIKKRWYVCACIYINIMCYSVLKKKSVLSNATKWMKLEDIMLSEIS